MLYSHKNVSQNSGGGAICKKRLPRKVISFSLVLALMLSTLAFNPNAGPPTLADETDVTTPTTLWDGFDESGYSFADLSNFIEPNGKNGFKTKTPKEGIYSIDDFEDLAGLSLLVNTGNLSNLSVVQQGDKIRAVDTTTAEEVFKKSIEELVKAAEAAYTAGATQTGATVLAIVYALGYGYEVSEDFKTSNEALNNAALNKTGELVADSKLDTALKQAEKLLDNIVVLKDEAISENDKNKDKIQAAADAAQAVVDAQRVLSTETTINGYDFAGKTIQLTADIDLKDHQWVPIGYNFKKPFRGNVDGQGKTITNMMIGSEAQPATYNYAGLFGRIEADEETKAISIKDINIGAGSHVYTKIGGYSKAAADEAYDAAIAAAEAAYAEAIAAAAEAYDAAIAAAAEAYDDAMAAEADDDAIAAADEARAAAYNAAYEVYDDAIAAAEAAKTADYDEADEAYDEAIDKAEARAAGICAYAGAGTITISGCSNSASIMAQGDAAGICAEAYAEAGTISISGCSNSGQVSAQAESDRYGDIDSGDSEEAKVVLKQVREESIKALATSNYSGLSGTIAKAYKSTDKEAADALAAGIIAATFAKTITISECRNSAKIEAQADDEYDADASGICAYDYGYNIEITNCYNYDTGNVIAHDDASGIIADAYAIMNITISGCSNSASITAQADNAEDISLYNAAGIVAIATTNELTISSCSNTGDISASIAAGIVAIATTNKLIISSCINTSDISAIIAAAGILAAAIPNEIPEIQVFPGFIEAASITITNCYNTGIISAEGVDLSDLSDLSANPMSAVMFLGIKSILDLDAISAAAGICVFAGASTTITNCYNTGNIYAGLLAAGILNCSVSIPKGDDSSQFNILTSTATISNCYNTGDISTNMIGASIFNALVGSKLIANNVYYLKDCVKNKNGETVEEWEQTEFVIGIKNIIDNSQALEANQMQAAAGTTDEKWEPIKVKTIRFNANSEIIDVEAFTQEGFKNNRKMPLVEALNAGTDEYNNTKPDTDALYWGIASGENNNYPTHRESKEVVIEKYTVTFEANAPEGTAVTGSMNAQEFTYGVAQKLTANAFKLEGYEFKGWSTKSDATAAEYTDNQEVSNLTSNITLYAIWGEIQADPEEKAIKVEASENGEVKLSANKAKAGDTVSFTVIPKEGYEVGKVFVNGEEITAKDDGSYEFTMPENDVTLKVEFIEKNGNELKGWVEGEYAEGETPVWYYYKDGKKLEGWQEIEIEVKGREEKVQRYYFNPERDYAMHTGWLKTEEGDWYYFDVNVYMDDDKLESPYEGLGMMHTGWANDGGIEWYYLDAVAETFEEGRGKQVVEWVNDGGDDWYYYDKEEGELAINWELIDGKWYFFSDDANNIATYGQMKRGWQLIDGAWYYFDTDENNKGEMIVGWKKIDGIWYYFDENRENNDDDYGKMVTGWQLIYNVWYYFYEDEPYDGDLAVNTVIDGYQLDGEGRIVA